MEVTGGFATGPVPRDRADPVGPRVRVHHRGHEESAKECQMVLQPTESAMAFGVVGIRS